MEDDCASQYKTRSYASSSTHSSTSRGSTAAARARAEAEAAKTRLLYADKEQKMKMAKFQLEVSMERLALEKEVAIATAKASVLEAAASMKGHSCKLPFDDHLPDATQRTQQYVMEQDKTWKEMRYTQQEEQPLLPDNMCWPPPGSPTDQAVNDPHLIKEGNASPTAHATYLHPHHHAAVAHRTEHPFITQSHFLSPIAKTNPFFNDVNPYVATDLEKVFLPNSNPAQKAFHGKADLMPAHDYNDSPEHTHPAPDNHITDFVRFLARRELVTTGILQFNDKPESYRAWRKSFHNGVRGLDLTDSEETDLLVKWLGTESAEHAKRIRAVHVNQPSDGLRMIWNRLDECYGSPEAIERALFQKLDNFPKISKKDYTKLRDLSDLLMELNMAKKDGDLPGLSYLDTAKGIGPIVQRLPHNLQESWLVYGSNYKREFSVAFPPFSAFVSFIQKQAKIRNDPGFMIIDHADDKSEKPSWKNRSKQVSAYATEVSSEAHLDHNRHERRAEESHNMCPIHRKPHTLQDCRGFRAKTIEDRKQYLKENGICFKCCISTSHTARECRATLNCNECDSNRHCTALHPGPAQWEEVRHPYSEHSGEPGPIATTEVTSQCTQVCGGELANKSCAKILLAKVYPRGQRDRAVKTYVILDEQSNRSLARSEFFNTFDVNGPTTSYSLKTCSGVTQNTGRIATDFLIESLDSKTIQPLPRLLECNDIPDNRAEIPTPSAALFHPHLKSVAPFIPNVEPHTPILLLLGRDVICLHKVRKHLNGPPHAPYAQKLDLGWVIMGKVCLGSSDNVVNVSTFFTNALEQRQQKTLQHCPSILSIREKYGAELCTLGSGEAVLPKTDKAHLGKTVFEVTRDDDKPAPSIDDLTFTSIMAQGVHKDESNSWVAPLPFRRPRQRLPDNRPQAFKRFLALKRSLERKPEMREHFFSFMEKILENGHAEVAPELCKGEERWYLPIFGVYHPKKPNNIRVVFDSSAQHDGVSLNNVLLTGPDLNNTLVGVLLRFRREAIAATADIKQMFHCFVVRAEDRNFLRFFWFRNNDPTKDVIEYRMTVHVFGNSPSPAVAIYCLRQSVAGGEVAGDLDVKDFVTRDFYVDDGLKSLPTAKSTLSLLKRTQRILANSNLRLHKIASNSKEVMDGFSPEDRANDLKDLELGSDSPPLQRSLGLSWNLKSDTFIFQVDINEKPFTRRGVLSVVNSIYDPLGFVSPVIIEGKYILRQLTQEKTDWDSPLPREMEDKWTSWRQSLEDLSSLHVPRPYTEVSPTASKWTELCVFSDASVKAIAAVAYLKVTDDHGNTRVGFVMSKAKLAPRPEHTIPRLELCAAVLAVELADLIKSELDLHLNATTFFTDSKVVLGYIHNEARRFYVYVSNRVIRIRKSSQPQQWRYVATNQNPADLATRSVVAAHLPNTVWLTGPAFLCQADVQGLKNLHGCELVDPDKDVEVRPISVFITNTEVKQPVSRRFSKFSSWRSLTRAIANLSHIKQSYGGENSNDCRRWHICKEAHTVSQLDHAKDYIIRAAQEETYGEELTCLHKEMKLPPNSRIVALDPFVDGQGLLRVGGRIKHGDFRAEEKNPLIIPGNHHISTLLVRHYHEQTFHQGRVFTEGAIRAAGLWIIGMRRCVNSVIYHCVTCRRLRRPPEMQKMPSLPADRLSMDPPFTNVGLDVFGPWPVVARRTRGGLAHSKRWAVIFTCLSVRAVHIEVIESLDTSSFINALRRFVALRGPVKHIRSDRGTNFVGAAAELNIQSNVDWASVEQHLTNSGCTWTFNPPHASHMGGAWERMVGMAKGILDSMFLQTEPTKLTHEMLITLMAEVAAIINARPLIPVSTDPDDPVILTPSTLLTQKVGVPMEPIDNIEVKDIFKRQWRQVQHLAQTFWSRWRKHYLASLQPRKKWQTSQPNLLPGSIVLLKDQQLKRNHWPLGIVTTVFPSKDNMVRKVEIKVSKGNGTKVFLRPISETILLLPPSSATLGC